MIMIIMFQESVVVGGISGVQKIHPQIYLISIWIAQKFMVRFINATKFWIGFWIGFWIKNCLMKKFLRTKNVGFIW